MHPAEPVTQFISTLIEEFGDEWGNKWMFHYRWFKQVGAREAVQKGSAIGKEAFAESQRQMIKQEVNR